MNTGVENAAQVLARLEGASVTAEEWLHDREEDLAKASEQAVHSAGERIKELSGILSHDLQESSRAAADKWIADIDAKLPIRLTVHLNRSSRPPSGTRRKCKRRCNP